MFVPSRIVLAVTVVAVGLTTRRASPGQAIDEYRVKAGFVATFASFVNWPPEAFKGPHEPLRLCVLGANPFGTALAELAEGKIVDGRRLAVQTIADIPQAEGCHIVFISSSEHLRLRSILDVLHKQSVFSVGDTSDFLAEGGIVHLCPEGGRMRMDINLKAATEQHLRISSRLLQLAKEVKR